MRIPASWGRTDRVEHPDSAIELLVKTFCQKVIVLTRSGIDPEASRLS